MAVVVLSDDDITAIRNGGIIKVVVSGQVIGIVGEKFEDREDSDCEVECKED